MLRNDVNEFDNNLPGNNISAQSALIMMNDLNRLHNNLPRSGLDQRWHNLSSSIGGVGEDSLYSHKGFYLYFLFYSMFSNI